MKKVVRLNEKDIESLVKKIIKEDERPRGSAMYSKYSDVTQGVIDRVREYGEEYIESINELNSEFPVTKSKNVEPIRNVNLPAGVRVGSTTYPTNESRRKSQSMDIPSHHDEYFNPEMNDKMKAASHDLVVNSKLNSTKAKARRYRDDDDDDDDDDDYNNNSFNTSLFDDDNSSNYDSDYDDNSSNDDDYSGGGGDFGGGGSGDSW